MRRRSILKGFVAAGAAAAVSGPQEAHALERKQPPPDAVGMLYDATLCIGCKACVVACREANDLPPTRSEDGLHDAQLTLDAHTKNVIKLYREGSVWSFMKSQCMHCVDPACVSACMIGALQKGPQGIVSYNPDACVGCRYCQVACPFNVPKFQWSDATPEIVKCELCRGRLAAGKEPACTEVCPADAVIFGRLADLKVEARRRIKDDPGRYQPKVYGEDDLGGTQVLYLSAAAVPYGKLGLPEKGERSVPQISNAIQRGLFQGFIVPGVLYVGLAAVVVRNWRKHPEREVKREVKEEKP